MAVTAAIYNNQKLFQHGLYNDMLKQTTPWLSHNASPEFPHRQTLYA